MTPNGNEVRDVGRVLHKSKDTVCSAFKKTLQVSPYFLNHEEIDQMKELEVEIHFSSELDEFWSFIGNKSDQRRPWYAIERKSGIISAWHNGKKRDADFLGLWFLLANFPITCYHTDDWGSIRDIFLPECIALEKTIYGK